MANRFRKVKLTQGQYALVDAEDYDRITQHKWWAQWYKNTQSYYAQRRAVIGGKVVHLAMHREILGLEHSDARFADHIKPGKTLDNRRKNLRAADHSESAMNKRCYKNNSTGYKGVYPYKDRFTACIQVRGMRFRLGIFTTAQKAARAYRTAAAKYHCDFMCTKGKSNGKRTSR